MLVVFTSDLPPSVRGKMKLWFLELVPNVFISGINDSLAKKVASYLISYSPKRSGLLILEESNEPPGYRILANRNLNRKIVENCRMQLFVKSLGMLEQPSPDR